MVIYLIVNRVTGKYYVGQHKGDNLNAYFQTKVYAALGGRGGSSHLFSSIRKYGPEVFTIHALLPNVQTKVESDQYERDFIAFLKSQKHEYGYNICRGGEGFTGNHTKETRSKISQNNARYWLGKNLSVEHAQKLREGREVYLEEHGPWNKGLSIVPWSEARRKSLHSRFHTNPNFGKKRTPNQQFQGKIPCRFCEVEKFSLESPAEVTKR